MANVYLYTGIEIGEKNDAIATLKKSAEKKYGAIDEHLFYANESSVAEIVTILQSASLFSNASFVLVKNAEAIKKKDEVKTLVDWIKIANDNQTKNTLVLVSDENKIDATIEKNIPSSQKKIFWEMFEERKIPYLINYFQKRGYAIEDEACEVMLDLVENNTQSLRNEAERFFILFPKEHAITADDIENVLAHTKIENAFTLFDAMCESESESRRFQNALSVLQAIRLSKDSSAQLLIAGLTSCFRRLQIWHALSDAGECDDFHLRTNGFSSKKAKAQYTRAASLWSAGQTHAILATLANADLEIRSGSANLETIILEKMLYEIVIKKGGTLLDYIACGDDEL